MLSYCLKCGNKAEIKNPKVVKTKNRRIMLLSTVRFPIVKNQDQPKSKKP